MPRRSHFNDMPILKKSDVVIPQHQRRENLRQKLLPSLMSLKLDLPLQQQYSIGSPPAPLMSLCPPFHHSPSPKSNNSRTKFCSKKCIYNRFKRNPKCHHHFDRREPHRRRQTFKSTAKFTNDIATNVRATSPAQEVANKREEYETILKNDENPIDIYIAVDTEMIELS